MPLAAKAFFSVTAGVIPGTAEPGYTKQWSYSSLDFEADVKALEADPERQTSDFIEKMDAAYEYARSITDPRAVNWVKVEFIWI